MQFHHILYAILLLANKQKQSFSSPSSTLEKLNYLLLKIKLELYDITKKIGYLSLVALFINIASAVESGDIKNTPSLQYPPVRSHSCLVEPMTEADYARYINCATALAPAPRTFDYDPSLLPDVAEVIFALRIKHANIGERFVINLSGNYLLEFTKDKISTEETVLSEILSHPFYEITGNDGVVNKVKVTKAAVFYHRTPSYTRHARCVKESKSVLEQLKDILGLGSGVCGSKGESDLRSANHESVEDMKLDNQLVEAVASDQEKFREAVGYRLRVSLDLKGQNALAFVASSYHCKKTIMERLKIHRRRRDLDNCLDWATQLVTLYQSLGLNYNNLYQIVQIVAEGNVIDASFFPDGQYPENSELDRDTLQQIIFSHRDQATTVLLEAAALAGMAAMAAPSFTTDDQGNTLPSLWHIINSVSEARVGYYTLVKENFTHLTNEVLRLNSSLEKQLIDDEIYTTDIMYVADARSNMQATISYYKSIIKKWEDKINGMMQSVDAGEREQLELSLTIVPCIYSLLSKYEDNPDLVIGGVYSNNILIGITIGYLTGRTYIAEYALVLPTSILQREGAYRGAVAYLRSEVLRDLFGRSLIDDAEADVFSKYAARSVFKLGFKHDHDEL